MAQTFIVISTVVSALAALSVACLTLFLVRATNRYVAETAKYVRLVQEQLDLLRAQLAAPLFLSASFIQGTTPQLVVSCRHSGNPSSLNAILRAVTLQLLPPQGAEEAKEPEEHRLDNVVLKPGKTWRTSLGGTVALRIGRLPAPGFWRALLHGGPRQQTVARLCVTLRFQRGGQTDLEEVTSEYEVRTQHVGGPALVPLW